MDFLKKPAVVFNPIGIIHNYYRKPVLQNICK